MNINNCSLHFTIAFKKFYFYNAGIYACLRGESPWKPSEEHFSCGIPYLLIALRRWIVDYLNCNSMIHRQDDMWKRFKLWGFIDRDNSLLGTVSQYFLVCATLWLMPALNSSLIFLLLLPAHKVSNFRPKKSGFRSISFWKKAIAPSTNSSEDFAADRAMEVIS